MSALDDLHQAWRSYAPATLLYTPGDDPVKIGKLHRFAPDAAVLDLEDAVADDQKVAARQVARAGVQLLPDSMLRMVRVNNVDTGLTQGDVAEVFCTALDGVVYPKLQAADELWELDRWLTEAERAAGVDTGRTAVIALIETARAMVRVDELLADLPRRVLTVGFGVGDFSVDLGIELADYGAHLDYARSRVVIAARAAELAPPVDGPWLRLHDLDGLGRDSARSRAFGFGGRQVIYPTHVPVANGAYVELTDERREHLERVVDQFEAAEAGGRAALQVDGQMVDYPIYHRARRQLAAAARVGSDTQAPAIRTATTS